MSLLRSSSVPQYVGSTSSPSFAPASGPGPIVPLRKARLNRYHSSDTVDQATISDRFRSLPSNVPQNHDDPFSLSGFFPSGIGLSNSGRREKEWEWLRPYDDHAHEDSLYEAAILHRPSAGEGWNAVGRSESGEAENTSSAVAAIKLDDKLGAMTVTGKPYLHQSQHSSDWVELKERGKKKTPTQITDTPVWTKMSCMASCFNHTRRTMMVLVMMTDMPLACRICSVPRTAQKIR